LTCHPYISTAISSTAVAKLAPSRCKAAWCVVMAATWHGTRQALSPLPQSEQVLQNQRLVRPLSALAGFLAAAHALAEAASAAGAGGGVHNASLSLLFQPKLCCQDSTPSQVCCTPSLMMHLHCY